MSFIQTLRWFGPDDPVTLDFVRQAGASGVVTALHHLRNGEVWPADEIRVRKDLIEKKGLEWVVVESVPVHEDIKTRTGDFSRYIDHFKQTIRNLGREGIKIICYNFMPLLDWTRTDLDYELSTGAKALRFSKIALASFDMFILQRNQAQEDYTDDEIKLAQVYYSKQDANNTERLTKNILAGLPGSEESYSLEAFRNKLHTYKEYNDTTLQHNLLEFLKEIIPAAEESDVRMAIHPDDPPFSILGLPRVVCKRDQIYTLLKEVKSPSNGITFCTGSLGVRPDNDLIRMAEEFGPAIHFVHLRNIQREDNGAFIESGHLEGDVPMYEVAKELLIEMHKRKSAGMDDRIPMRPDHGHRLIADGDLKVNPGYSGIGRLKGLAELRGLEMGIEKSFVI